MIKIVKDDLQNKQVLLAVQYRKQKRRKKRKKKRDFLTVSFMMKFFILHLIILYDTIYIQ